MRLALLLFLALAGTAMAKDGTVQAPKGPLQPKTKAEEFWQSDKGQWIDQQFQRLQNGEITLEQAQQEYDQKFGKPDLMAKPDPSPVSPLVPKDMSPWQTR